MISIIIPTKNDFDLLATLESVTKAKKPEKTEIIVIDASEKETLLHIKKRFSNVKWIYYKNKTGKKRTFAEQLNVGTNRAKGDILVFVDAGCIVEKDWLVELTKPLIKEKEYFVLGFVKPIGKSHHNLEKKSKYLDSCGTANTAIKRSVALKVGERDVRFSYGSDIDFSWRAIDLGYKIRYVPTAIMYHNWGNFKQEVKRSKNYGIAKARLYKKHKSRLLKVNLLNIQTLSYPIFILGLPITFFWKYYPLLLIIPFIKDINKNPFKTLTLNMIFGMYFLKEFFLGKNEKYC